YDYEEVQEALWFEGHPSETRVPDVHNCGDALWQHQGSPEDPDCLQVHDSDQIGCPVDPDQIKGQTSTEGVELHLPLQRVQELPPPPSEPLHDLRPGDWIMVKKLNNGRKKRLIWDGPHQVLQSSNSGVMIAEGATWLDTSEFKRAFE
ncbi:unnamed protein product, partial [Tetraodon nigroviridis]